MKRLFSLFVTLFAVTYLFAQETTNAIATDSLDTSYKEDQFYFGVSYNALSKMPKGMSQNGFSSGFHLGIIKDMPINKKRNWAIGIGLGYATNSINQNLKISENPSGGYTYELLTSSQFTKNKFSQHLVELPFEIRWRTSTASTYKFWRVYTGVKFGYVFASNTKFKDSNGQIKNNNIEDFERLQYGLTLSAGYDSWNAYLYYSLNPVFKKEAQLSNENLDVSIFKVGIMFYLL